MQDADGDVSNRHVIDNNIANQMSLFYANATPMLRVLSDATSRFVADVRLNCCFILYCQPDFLANFFSFQIFDVVTRSI